MKSIIKHLKLSKRLSRIGALLVVLLMSFTLVACSISIPSTEQNDHATEPELVIKAENDRYFREDEWIRMLNLAISNLKNRSTLWLSIPPIQRAEITLSDFIEYTDFLSASLPGTMKSYSRATAEETDSIRAHVIKNDKTLVPNPQRTSIWWFYTETSDARTLQFAVPITLNQQGIPYFSKSWIQKQLAMYHYIVLYLEAVEHRNSPALKSLIRQNTAYKSKIHEEAINKRVSALINHYFRSVMPGKGAYRITEMVPGYAIVEQQSIVGHSSTQQNRTVVFLESDGIITANEKFPQVLSSDDRYLFVGNRPLFGLGQEASKIESEQAISILGVPLDIRIIDDSDPQTIHYQLIWPGLTIDAIGTCNLTTLEFNGNIRQISATYSQFNTGTGLKPGDSIYELHKRYPFIRESGYAITRIDTLRRTLSVQVENDIIVRLTITLEPN